MNCYLVTGVLLDILQRTGVKGYEAFLESLELDYPDVYRKITGKEPARVFSVLIGELYYMRNHMFLKPLLTVYCYVL